MNYSIHDIHVDTNMLTVADIQSASRQIFELKEGEFEKIRNQKWYHDLLRAVTFGVGDRKRIISDITSINKLQQLFMQIYLQYYKDYNAQLDQLVDDLLSLNSTVYKLYMSCVAKIDLHKDISDFDPVDSARLQLLLCAYVSQNGNEEAFKAYRRKIMSLLPTSDTESVFDAQQLRLVQNPEVFYRCACEMCSIDGCLSDNGFPADIETALDELVLSQKKCREIRTAVIRQAENFGSDYFWTEKYQPNREFSTEGICLVECHGSTNCMYLGADTTDSHSGNETCDPVDAVTSDNFSSKYSILSAHLKSYLDRYPLGCASEKAQENFLQKYMPMVTKKTIVGMTKVPEVVLTTWGIHFLNKKQEPIALAYKNIDFTKTTVTRNDAGMPLGVYLRTRDTTTQDYLHIQQSEEFLEMLQKAAQMETAQTDSIKPVSQMPEAVKFAYGKLLVFFGQQCKLEWIESIRMAHDTKMMRETFETLLIYAYGNHAENELNDLIRDFKESLPYPNEESISYALIQSLVALIQFSSGRCREITAFETSKIDEIAGELEISKEIVDKLIPVAQIPYRTLKRDITPKEISNATQALATIAAGVGIPVATVLGSAFLWANTLWFMFIPGIGTVITTAALGVTAVTALFGGKRKSDSELMEKNIQTQMESLIESYTSLLNTVLDLPQCKSEISLVLEAAKRTDYGLEKHLSLELSGKNVAICPENGGVAPSEYGNTIGADKKAEIFELVDSLKKKGGSFYKSRLDMSESECTSILWQMTHLQKEYISQVVGLYDVSIANAITGNVSGILFAIDGFYFKQTPTSAPQYMPYSEITSVEEKFSTLIIRGAETSITMKSISYAQSYIVELFNKLKDFSN